MNIKINNVNEANWREINVRSNMPENLRKLEEIAYNYWWVWDSEAKSLFRHINHEAWVESESNPVRALNLLNYDELIALSNNKEFLAKIDAIYTRFLNYMQQPMDKTKTSVAYFSMEYGLSHVLKIYSGGLGVLAGDYIKEASDSLVDMTAIGFLYRYGYFTQTLSVDGQQIANYEAQNFNNLPIRQVKDSDGHPIVVEVPYPDRTVYAYLWQAAVGRVNLYLLDTDNDMNSEFDRSITHQLYGGDWENRLKQEIMLGIGGVLALKKLGIEKQVYHCNEGHAALINAQRMADFINEKGLTFNQALQVVRSSSIYTVHTPVPAGHDAFTEDLFGKYMYAYPDKLKISWNDFIDMGRTNPGDRNEKFNMSTFACNTCQEVNGVSWLHGKVSQEMFAPIWKGYFPSESHVGYVTNGVHLPTWAASEWKGVYNKYLAKGYEQDQSNPKIWEAIYNIPDSEIWDVRMRMKKRLVAFIKEQFQNNWLKNQGDPSRIVSIIETINPDALIIGFGRRFATYKRAHLLFTDLNRLEKIVNNPTRPVQFLFTGKAHPADGGGQGLIKRIIEVSRLPQFLGKIIFLENYDMRLAKRLISGVDIWLNTPTRPLEASGTSGEKAQMNGVLNFSVLDGWWKEGYVEGAGWALTDKITYENQDYQDQLDAATIYSKLENEIIPLYFAKNELGYSPEWVQTIKNSFAKITPHFTMKRMIDDYINKFYKKMAARSKTLTENNFQKAKELAAWKEKISAAWDYIEPISVSIPEGLLNEPRVGENYPISVVIDTKNLNDNGIGVEMVITETSKTNKVKLSDVEELELVKTEGTKLHFALNYALNETGTFQYAFRMFPKNSDLPHRQDFCYVRWL
ncbi:MAG: alpha-glucan family phosphorylase [Prevotellaceae bacterium]|jgi:starch phosphorylase|nr:alpha-glucan family phosphorylase [Prevotellaceae bacterium]